MSGKRMGIFPIVYGGPVEEEPKRHWFWVWVLGPEKTPDEGWTLAEYWWGKSDDK